MRSPGHKIFYILFFTIILFCSACKKKKSNKDPIPKLTPDAQELITTFKLTFFDGTTSTSYSYRDQDGDGGLPAFYGPGTNTASTQNDSVIQLTNNKNYTVTIELFDESKIPVEVVSDAVKEEGVDHMFFFNQNTPTALPNALVTITGTNLVIDYLDHDAAPTPLPIGLLSKWSTGNAATKKAVNIELKHQPGAKNGSYTPGEVDAAVIFKVLIN